MGRKVKPAQIVYIHEYMTRKVQSVREQILEIERVTGILMNQLIREKDHGIARRLQREIGRLDAKHTELQDLLKSEEQRQLRYAGQAQ